MQLDQDIYKDKKNTKIFNAYVQIADFSRDSILLTII